MSTTYELHTGVYEKAVAPVTCTDMAHVTRVIKSNCLYAYNDWGICTAINNTDKFSAILCVVDTKPVGVLLDFHMLSTTGNKKFLRNNNPLIMIYVDREHRRKGIATKLISKWLTYFDVDYYKRKRELREGVPGSIDFWISIRDAYPQYFFIKE